MHQIIKLIKSFFHIFGIEISKHNKRQNYWLKDYDINSIIDIGANTGQFIFDILKVLPNAEIYSFEPLKGCYDSLIKNKKIINNQKIKIFNYGIGDKSQEVEINHHKNSPSSSILESTDYLEQKFPFTKDSQKELISIKKLDDIFDSIEIKDNVLVKIDVQGYEKNVILGGIETLKRSKIIIIENSFYELYKGQALFSEIFRLLDSIGFEYQGSLFQIVDKNGNILQQDSIFNNKNI